MRSAKRHNGAPCRKLIFPAGALQSFACKRRGIGLVSDQVSDWLQEPMARFLQGFTSMMNEQSWPKSPFLVSPATTCKNVCSLGINPGCIKTDIPAVCWRTMDSASVIRRALTMCDIPLSLCDPLPNQKIRPPLSPLPSGTAARYPS